MQVDGEVADGYASLSALRSEQLLWPEWIGRANRFSIVGAAAGRPR